VQEDFQKRFWAKTLKLSNGCVIWVGGFRGNYGAIRYKGKMVSAHRISWEMANNKIIPPGMLVCHSCDNPACVSPDCLSVCTGSENIRQALERGRRIPASGETHYNSKITDQEHKMIKLYFEKHGCEKWRKQAIGRWFDISKSTVERILYDKRKGGKKST
jgi:hypothetical protein